MGTKYVRLCQAPEKAEVVEGVISISRGCSLHPEHKGVAAQGKSHLGFICIC